MYKLIAAILLCFFSQTSEGQLVDPTKPLTVTAKLGTNNTGGNTELRLESVLVFGQSSTAIINGNAYKKGDLVSGFDYAVQEITRTTVLLSNTESSIELKLFKQAIVKQ